jgi:hypothetical protein
MKKLQSNTTYFLSEGRANMTECVRLSFTRAIQTGIQTLLIFTVNGEGLELACNEFLGDARFKGIRVVGVSYPFGSAPASALVVPQQRKSLLKKFGIPLVRGTCPIDDTPAPSSRQHNLVRKSLEIFSGGTALCVWAVLVACDTGLVPAGEHVISCCADTSILAKAATSAQLLTSFAIREIVCKPIIHDISKGEALAEEINIDALLRSRRRRPEPRQLSQTAEGVRPKK